MEPEANASRLGVVVRQHFESAAARKPPRMNPRYLQLQIFPYLLRICKTLRQASPSPCHHSRLEREAHQ
jgi:hypothetical protein